MDAFANANKVPTKQDTELAQMLVDGGLITQDQAEHAFHIQSSQGGDFGDILIRQGIISARDLATVRSLAMNVPYIDLRRHTVKPEVVKLIREETARRHLVVPLDIVEDTLIVVMANPEDFSVVQDLEVQAAMSISPALGIESDIRDTINSCYDAGDSIEQQAPSDASAESSIPNHTATKESPNKLAGVQTLEALVTQAIEHEATGIHIEPNRSELRVRYRIEGVLHEIDPLPPQARESIVSKIKVLGGMSVGEVRRAQESQFTLDVQGSAVSIRVFFMPVAGGEKLTLRVPRKLEMLRLSETGLSEDGIERCRGMLERSAGMILFSGPTGSGRTTMLAACLREIDRRSRCVMTIEDPIELLLDDVTQSQVNRSTGVTYSTGLEAILQHDPDVIVVGEIEDAQTAQTAVRTALAGCLVLGGIRADNAAAALHKLVDLGINPRLVSNAVLGAMGQRIAKFICPKCRTPAPPSPEEAAAYKKETGSPVPELYVGSGCHACANTGTGGRIGVFELLQMSPAVARLLCENALPEDIRAQAITDGMRPLPHDAMLKAQSGILTISEAVRLTAS